MHKGPVRGWDTVMMFCQKHNSHEQMYKLSLFIIFKISFKSFHSKKYTNIELIIKKN